MRIVARRQTTYFLRISRKLVALEERILLSLMRVHLHLVHGWRRMALTRRRTLPGSTGLHFQRLQFALFNKLTLLQQLGFVPGFMFLGLVLVLYLNQLLFQTFLEFLDALTLNVLSTLPEHTKSSLLAFASTFWETNKKVSRETNFALGHLFFLFPGWRNIRFVEDLVRRIERRNHGQ